VTDTTTFLSGAVWNLPPPASALPPLGYSTVTDFARLRGLSTSLPRSSAA
jgi:hypothetical protein